MRIERMELYNISSYSGLHEFDFRTDGDRNIILIGGQNGTGKTSLFTAIKLALYGPLCFHFQSKNNQYTARIKELISHDAFAMDEVRAHVELTLTLPRDQEMVTYTIRREWSYVDKQLTERDAIKENGHELEPEELDFFQNYLYQIIPPNLFDFFFFDGEEIAGFFSNSSYRTYLKNAILTLDHYDTFGLIERYCHRYVVPLKDMDKARQLREEYDAVCDELERAGQVRQEREERIGALQARRQEVKEELEELERRFKLRGGLSPEEMDRLQREIDELEKRRDQINSALKNFAEEMAPLLLTKPVTGQLQAQLKQETQVQQYEVLARELSPERLADPLAGLLPQFGVSGREWDFAQALSEKLKASVRPDIDVERFVFLHDLSAEQRGAVNGVLDQIAQFDPEDIVGGLEEKDRITNALAELRKRTEMALSPEEVAEYERRREDLRIRGKECEGELERETEAQAEYEAHLEQVEGRRRSLRGSLAGATRKVDAVQYTERAEKMMGAMLAALLERKRQEIEEETLRLAKEILRKEHFIDLVELDENFEISLYRRQTYTFEELSALYTNMGLEEFTYRLGRRGVELLKGQLQLDSVQGLKKVLRQHGGQVNLMDDKELDLYKRIEFQQLSKGEKQIFILSLYWAIIKTSGKDIPFVIDTPYARIDMEHREQIAEKFFPTVSRQVIILSTDEEITAPYYRVLKPHIAKEYTLSYDESVGRTQAAPGYLFGGVRK